MGWIKRNLFFVVFGLVALGALGGAGFYIYRGFSNNTQQAQQLQGIYSDLGQMNQAPLQPGNDKINNTELAKEQEKELRAWIARAAVRFHPIAPIPAGDVTSKTFATALGTTIYELTQEAKESSVALPPQPPYCFSFQVQNNILSISSGLGPLAQQLGEVKAISEVLFAAGVNNLDSIQRVRVSEDDVTKGVATDYTDKVPITNSLAVMTPYVLTFRGFTPELARTVAGFANSTNLFIVKSISVQKAGTETEISTDAGNGMQPAPYDAGANRYRGAARYGRVQQPVEQPAANGFQPGKGGLQTALKEQLLRVTIEVDVVKLELKS
jgi:hypothetical protein